MLFNFGKKPNPLSLRKSLKNGTSYRKSPATSASRDATTVMTALHYPSAAAQIGAVERGGTNISTVSGRIARHMAENDNMSVGIGSERNGFRHALWSATIASRFGQQAATDITNSHEAIGMGQNASIDFSMPMLQDREHADEIVDLLNNEIGRGIAAGMGENATTLDIARAVLDTQLDQGVYITVTLENGELSIQRQKITQEQYDQALQMLQTLDDNGLNDNDRRQLEEDN